MKTTRGKAKKEFDKWLVPELANAVTIGSGSSLFSFKEKVMKKVEHLLEKQREDIFSRLPTKQDPVTREEILDIIERVSKENK